MRPHRWSEFSCVPITPYSSGALIQVHETAVPTTARGEYAPQILQRDGSRMKMNLAIVVTSVYAKRQLNCTFCASTPLLAPLDLRSQRLFLCHHTVSEDRSGTQAKIGLSRILQSSELGPKMAKWYMGRQKAFFINSREQQEKGPMNKGRGGSGRNRIRIIREGI